jgi:hypothetical protein
MTDQLKKNYYRGWDENEEHLTAFALRLDEEQAKLLSDGITITTIDKCQHYMLQIWNCGQFNKQTMTEWSIKPAGEKLYPQAVIFFNLKMRNSEQYEAASGNSTAKNGFDSANAALEITELLNTAKADATAATEALQRRDEEHALAMRDMRTEMRKEAIEDSKALRSDIDKLTALVQKLTARSPKRMKRAKRVQFEDESDSERDDEPPTPPVKRKHSICRRTPSSATNSSTFKKGDKFHPDLKWDHTWDQKTKDDFHNKQKAYRTKNPEWAAKERLARLTKLTKQAREVVDKI